MRKLIPLFTLLFLLGTLPLLTGCGKPPEPPAKPLGPAESMEALMQGVADQKMEAVWNFIPDSYQQQINDQTHALADKMDPELYDGIFNTAQRITKLLKDKKEYILKNQMIQGLPVPPEKLGEFWDPTVGLLDTIANGEMSSVAKLKKLDGKTYLANEGNAVLKQVFKISDMLPQKEGEPSFPERIKQTKVTLVSEEGDKATIKIEAPGEEPREQAMVKVEDKWIPDTLAANWDKQLAKSKKSIDEITPEMIAEQKKQIMPVLENINTQLAKLENAKSEEEFNAMLTPIIAPVAILGPMLQMQLGQAMGSGPAGPGPGGMPSLGEPERTPVSPTGKPKINMATVKFSRKLSFEEQEPFVKEVAPIAKEAGALRVLPGSESGLTVIRISPMPDFAKFSAGMQKKFKAAEISKIDTDTNTITVEVP